MSISCPDTYAYWTNTNPHSYRHTCSCTHTSKHTHMHMHTHTYIYIYILFIICIYIDNIFAHQCCTHWLHISYSAQCCYFMYAYTGPNLTLNTTILDSQHLCPLNVGTPLVTLVYLRVSMNMYVCVWGKSPTLHYISRWMKLFMFMGRTYIVDDKLETTYIYIYVNLKFSAWGNIYIYIYYVGCDHVCWLSQMACDVHVY